MRFIGYHPVHHGNVGAVNETADLVPVPPAPAFDVRTLLVPGLSAAVGFALGGKKHRYIGAGLGAAAGFMAQRNAGSMTSNAFLYGLPLAGAAAAWTGKIGMPKHRTRNTLIAGAGALLLTSVVANKNPFTGNPVA